MDAAGTSQPASARRGGVVRWIWTGGLTSTSVSIVTRIVDGLAPVQVRLTPSGGGPAVTADAERADLDASGICRFRIDGLRPATAYIYQVVQAGIAAGPSGRVRTPAAGPHNTLILFGSCASTGSNAPIWDTMRALSPDLFVHMGDLHYQNITRNDPARFRAAFDRCLTSPRQGAFYRTVPIAYVWDDHDFGGDESTRHATSAEAAHTAYRECVPHYPLRGGPRDTIQQAFDIGRVRVIVTDVRSARDMPDRRDGSVPSMLGAAQLRWLLDEFEAASRRAALVVWANGVPWITKADEGTHHGWAPYHEERALIAAQIERVGLTSRLLMVSGDAHMVAIDDGTNSQYAPGAAPGSRGFVVAHAAAFDRFRRNKGGPYSLGRRAGRGQFGELRIQDDGRRLVATVTCRDARGRQIDKLSIRLTCVDGTCTVSQPGPQAPLFEHLGAA